MVCLAGLVEHVVCLIKTRCNQLPLVSKLSQPKMCPQTETGCTWALLTHNTAAMGVQSAVTYLD